MMGDASYEHVIMSFRFTTGFVTPPADYYIRPLMVEEHKHHKRNRYGGSNECLAGGKTPTQVLIQYITSVVSESQGKAPLFLLSWFTSVGHDEFNGLKVTIDNYRNH